MFSAWDSRVAVQVHAVVMLCSVLAHAYTAHGCASIYAMSSLQLQLSSASLAAAAGVKPWTVSLLLNRRGTCMHAAANMSISACTAALTPELIDQ
jgi:hypothetical protein